MTPTSPGVIIITGAGSGIGLATAQRFLRADWQVVLTGRRAERLEAAVAGSGADPARARCVAGDVGQSADVDAVFATAAEAFGRVDVLFNNAGIAAPAVTFDEISEADWDAVVRTNLTGSFLCAQRAFAAMRRQSPQGGRIINNGSISAYLPRPNSAPYTATKHAISGLTRSIALDGRAYNIACGQIDIGNARSEMTAGSAEGALQPNGQRVPEPLLDVEHVADSVLHMASLPLDANVLFMTVMATRMPFVGRG